MPGKCPQFFALQSLLHNTLTQNLMWKLVLLKFVFVCVGGLIFWQAMGKAYFLALKVAIPGVNSPWQSPAYGKTRRLPTHRVNAIFLTGAMIDVMLGEQWLLGKLPSSPLAKTSEQVRMFQAPGWGWPVDAEAETTCGEDVYPDRSAFDSWGEYYYCFANIAVGGSGWKKEEEEWR